jgi:hypothetical protein
MPPFGIRKMEPVMLAKKLTASDAMKLVERIEALQEQIDAVYAEARTYEGINNDSVIHDAVVARRKQREAAELAENLLGSFDEPAAA